MRIGRFPQSITEKFTGQCTASTLYSEYSRKQENIEGPEGALACKLVTIKPRHADRVLYVYVYTSSVLPYSNECARLHRLHRIEQNRTEQNVVQSAIPRSGSKEDRN